MTLHVAFVSDRNYLPWCATAMLSCIDAHQPHALHLHLVHDGTVTSADAGRLSALAEGVPLELHAVGVTSVGHLPALDRFGRIVWLRFLLPDLLPDVDRVLYLDADTFVAADLTELEVLDLHGAPVAAVSNVAPTEEDDRLRALGVVDAGGFLNSGVVLMDLARMRSEAFATKVATAASDLAGRIRWPDQDVLNAVVAGRWRRLHPRYNAQNSFFEWRDRAMQVLGADALREALADPAVVHFEGPYLCKPWHVLSQHPWRDRYRAVLARTPWADTPLDDDSALTRAIARLPAAWQLPVYEQVVRSRDGKRPSLRGALRRRAGASRPS